MNINMSMPSKRSRVRFPVYPRNVSGSIGSGMGSTGSVDTGGPVVIILASGSEVREFDPSRGRWIFSEGKNPEYDFLRKGSKAVGPVSLIYGT